VGTYSSGGAGEQVLGTLSWPLSVSCKFDQSVTLMDRDAAAAAGVVGVLDVGSSAADGEEASTPRKRQQELLRIQQVQESNRTFSSIDAVDNDDASQRERQLELLLQKQSDQENTTNTDAAANDHHQPLRLSSGWVNLVLSDVGVVQNLPVPFHISFRAIQLTPNIVALAPLSPSLFPEHYQRHVFWTNVAEQLQQLERQRDHPWGKKVQQQQPHSPLSPVVVLSSSSQPIPKQQQKGLLPPLHEKVCACCYQPNPQVRCGGGCQDVFYCDKVCQQGHWILHKKTCPQQQASFRTDATTATSFSSSLCTTSNGKPQERSGKNTSKTSEHGGEGKKKWWNKY
jgi:MYND finger